MAKHRKGPPTDVLKAEYLSGATTVTLARKYEMCPAAINGRLTRAGVVMRDSLEENRRKSTVNQNGDAIVDAYVRGESVTDIVAKFGGSRSSVQRLLAERKVKAHKLRPQTIRIPDDPYKIGYLAGMLDGEGNLQFKQNHPGTSIGGKLAIYSTTPSVMQWLVRNIGGHSRFDTKRTETKGWLPIGIWEIYRARDIAALLNAVLPHLLIKKQAAEHFLSLYHRHTHHDSPPTTTQSKPLTV